MIKKFLVLFYIVAFSIFLVKGVNADVLLEGTKDTFNLLEDNYDKELSTEYINSLTALVSKLKYEIKENENIEIINEMIIDNILFEGELKDNIIPLIKELEYDDILRFKEEIESGVTEEGKFSESEKKIGSSIKELFAKW